jgi:hypothetical protein
MADKMRVTSVILASVPRWNGLVSLAASEGLRVLISMKE